jgi:predicted alpha/beta-fold hydrolase
MSVAAPTARAEADDFLPPARLRSPHLQSIYPSLPLRRPLVERRCAPLLRASRDAVLDCGEGVRLLAHVATQAAAGRAAAREVAVLLHGWEGSARSLYLLALGQRLYDAGYDVVRLNLRDHGDSHGLNHDLFHSCRIAEVVGAVRRVQVLHPGQRLVLAGFSLGGNFMLRVGARAAAAGIEVSRIVAVCPVIDPAHTLQRLESGWALYRQYFIWKWRRSLRLKQAAWPDEYADLEEFLRLGNLTAMTDELARHFGGFPSLDEYLQGYALTGAALAPLAKAHGLRARIVISADDPIIAASDLDRIARPANLEIVRTRYGGHCGYYSGGRGEGWLDRQVLAGLAG